MQGCIGPTVKANIVKVILQTKKPCEWVHAIHTTQIEASSALRTCDIKRGPMHHKIIILLPLSYYFIHILIYIFLYFQMLIRNKRKKKKNKYFNILHANKLLHEFTVDSWTTKFRISWEQLIIS